MSYLLCLLTKSPGEILDMCWCYISKSALKT